MGLLKIFNKPVAMPKLTRLPSGSFTVDASGRMLASTLPHSFPKEQINEIGEVLLAIFKDAEETALPLSEIEVRYGGFKITARSMRGGAIIFLKPKELQPYKA